jgi:hypothetical protein
MLAHLSSINDLRDEDIKILLYSIIDGLIFTVEVPVVIEVQNWSILGMSWHKLYIYNN